MAQQYSASTLKVPSGKLDGLARANRVPWHCSAFLMVFMTRHVSANGSMTVTASARTWPGRASLRLKCRETSCHCQLSWTKPRDKKAHLGCVGVCDEVQIPILLLQARASMGLTSISDIIKLHISAAEEDLSVPFGPAQDTLLL